MAMSPQELNFVEVLVGAEEGGRAAGAEGLRGDGVRVNARLGFERRGSLAQGVGDMLGFDRLPLEVRGVAVDVDRRGQSGACCLKV